MTKANSNSSSPVVKPLITSSPLTDSASITSELSNTEFIVDDIELLSILASATGQDQIHAQTNHIQPPTNGILNWEDWDQDVPDFVNNKRKRNGDNLIDSDDDEEDEFSFLNQFDFVDVSFDHPLLTNSNKKQKINSSTNSNNVSFVDENADELSILLKQSDSLLAEIDCGWILDTIS